MLLPARICLARPLCILLLSCLTCGMTAGMARANFIDDISSSVMEFADDLTGEGSYITVRGGPRLAPDYLGSDDYELSPGLNLLVQLKGRLFISNGSTELNILGIDRLQLGPTLTLSGSRKESSNPALEGLGDIKIGPELGVFMRAVFSDAANLRLRLRHGIARGHEGLLADIELRAFLLGRAEDEISLVGGTGLTWANGSYMQRMFGIDAEQSALSGYSVYQPGSGLRDASVSLLAQWRLNEKWSVSAGAEYKHLLNGAARSPIVEIEGSSDILILGLTLNRRFNLD